MEEWRDIKRFEGRYMISNKGRILAVARRRDNGTTFKDLIMKPTMDKKGYLRIQLIKDRKKYPKKVHRLVAEAFIPNPDNKPQVNHIDCDKANNNVDNLEWCTNGENQIHAFQHGLNYVTGRSGRQKIPVEMIDTNTGKIIGRFISMNEASRQTKVPQPNIQKVIMGERHTAGGYGWRKAVGQLKFG